MWGGSSTIRGAVSEDGESSSGRRGRREEEGEEGREGGRRVNSSAARKAQGRGGGEEPLLKMPGNSPWNFATLVGALTALKDFSSEDQDGC